MVDDRPEDIELSPDLGRAKRAPPTLDLEATEVSDRSATEASDKSATDASDKSDTEPGVAATAGETPPVTRPRTRWLASALISAISGAGAAGLILVIVWLFGS